MAGYYRKRSGASTKRAEKWRMRMFSILEADGPLTQAELMTKRKMPKLDASPQWVTKQLDQLCILGMASWNPATGEYDSL